MKNLQMSFEQFEEANKLFDKLLNEIDEFSEIEKDMERGEELGKTSFGLDMKFKGDLCGQLYIF
jgi:hypothetical protein